MSISPSRAQARLAKTKSEMNAAIELLKKKLAEETAKLEGATNPEAQVALVRMVQSELDAALQLLANRSLAQEAAVMRKETSYPIKLRRHLRKCRKYGWADARLVQGKK